MIEKKLKTTAGKLQIKMPTNITEITLGQIMEMQEKADLNDLDAISILSGTPIEELQNIIGIDDLGTFGDCLLSLSDQIKNLYSCDVIPNKVSFMFGERNITIKVPGNLAIEPVGAFMAARDIIADEIKEHIDKYGGDDFKDRFNPSLKACCHVLAYYFFCRVTGKKYNEYEAEEFCSTVKKLRVTEALPIAKHFFIYYPSLSKTKTNCFRRAQQYWRKKLGSRHLKSSSI